MSDAPVTALVVDRDEEDRRTFSEQFGAEVTAFAMTNNVAAARAVLDKHDPEVMLLDMTDGTLDGMGLLQSLRAEPDGVTLSVIGIIDESHLDQADAILAAGADFLEMRPLIPELIRGRLRAARKQRQLRDQVREQLGHFRALNEIGVALSAERDKNRLAENILLYAKGLADADGGTIYLMSEDEKELRFAIVRTDSLNFALGGATNEPIPFAPLPLYAVDSGKPNHANIATHVALTAETVNIPDAYEADGFDFTGMQCFDSEHDYRSTSFLTIPMKNNTGEVIGVLQLINAMDRREGEVVPFTAEVQEVVESLASQAAVAIDNQTLLEGQRELLDAFIKLIAAAIDTKSSYQGDHCARVPFLTGMIADVACDAATSPFADFTLDEEQKYELMTAAWLHDCGKVTTPEYVVDKATKLETIYDRLHTVRARAEVLKRDAEIAYLMARSAPDAGALRKTFSNSVAAINDDLAFIERINVGGEFMSAEAVERVEQIAARTWCDANGEDQAFLTENEVYNLNIRRGTLTAEEREIINHHIVITIEMLEKLPFPKNLRKVPEFAGGHHERVDGKGYPRGLLRYEMSVPARIMAIADVFEALTASDRPYKSAMKLSVAMTILGKMKHQHHIDPDLFDLFVEHRIYERYAEQFLLPEQIDKVDVSEYLGPLPDAIPNTAPEPQAGT